MADPTSRRQKDPLFAAAVLKLTFERRRDEQSPHFKVIYEGVLRDLAVTDADVDAYLVAHLPAVEAAMGGSRGRGGDGP